MKQLLVITTIWLIILVGSTAYFATSFTYRPDFAYTSVTHFNPSLPSWVKYWLAPWANFDGVHYLQISGNGYVDQGRFLPLFPSLLGTLMFLSGGAETFSTHQLLLSLALSLAIFGNMIWVWSKLLKIDYSTKKVGWILALFIFFPTSFFLISIYTEGLFLLLVGLSLLLANQKKWWWALVPAALLTITRLTGFVIIPTLVYLKWQHDKPKTLSSFIRDNVLWLIGLGSTILPLIAYAYFNFVKWGDWLYFVHAHGALGNSRATSSIVLPPITIVRYLKILTTLSPSLHEFKVAALELLSFLSMTSLFILAWIKKVPRHYLLFCGLALLIPTLSGTLTGFPRYSLAALPLVICLADWPKPAKLALVTVGFILQLLLLSWFVTGYFVA